MFERVLNCLKLSIIFTKSFILILKVDHKMLAWSRSISTWNEVKWISVTACKSQNLSSELQFLTDPAQAFTHQQYLCLS